MTPKNKPDTTCKTADLSTIASGNQEYHDRFKSLERRVFSIPTMLAFGIAIFKVKETRGNEIRARASKNQRSFLRVFNEAIKVPQLIWLLIVITLTPFVFSGIETTFVMWSERAFGWGPQQNGEIYAFMGLTAAATQWFLVGRLTRKFGEHKLIFLGAILICTGSAMIPFTLGTISLCIAFGFIVFGVSINTPSLSSLVSKFAGVDERGSLLGIAHSCSAMARITGPAWAGFAFGFFGRDWPFFSGALVMVLMFFLAFLIKPKK